MPAYPVIFIQLVHLQLFHSANRGLELSYTGRVLLSFQGSAMQLKTNLLTDEFDAPVLKTFLVKDNVIQRNVSDWSV